MRSNLLEVYSPRRKLQEKVRHVASLPKLFSFALFEITPVSVSLISQRDGPPLSAFPCWIRDSSMRICTQAKFRGYALQQCCCTVMNIRHCGKRHTHCKYPFWIGQMHAKNSNFLSSCSCAGSAKQHFFHNGPLSFESGYNFWWLF